MNSKNKYKILLILFLISLISSIILTLKPTPPICEKGCDVVQTSKYATTLGIKNSLIGIITFSIILILISSHLKNPSKIKKKIISVSLLTGTIISIYFLYIQFFIIKAYCTYCIVVDFSLIVSLIIFFWRK